MTTNTTSEDQRKRTMDALERRFAFAKAEALQQLNHGKKRPVQEDEKDASSMNSSAIVSSPQLMDSSVANSSNASSKKGNFTFSGTRWQDVEESGPTYSQLPLSIHENLLTTNVMLSGRRGSAVDKILHELLQNGDSAQKYSQGSRSLKIDNWILLDNYIQNRGVSTGSHLRALQAHSKRSKKHMSMKQLKKSGLYDLPQDLQKIGDLWGRRGIYDKNSGCALQNLRDKIKVYALCTFSLKIVGLSYRFEMYKPMHVMWKSYLMQLLKTTGKNQLAQCLLTADLHGAIILVAECNKITAFTGVSGIMIRETAETFGIITQDNKFRVVPKKASVFIFEVDGWKITLLGDKLTSRNLGT
ncbi:hypothetical protein EZV62_016957 [Acer yangbiense]|uniref:Uncharacterized protein n=1 Tax=Acer yangbiense TaxID=1000413 RepID=A0A5C7HQR9_9ROSI|nr:hypothetical protein EZV62_016957 [Acer yangbiense]